MNLTEVMVAVLVFGLASNASVQLWGSSAAWSRRAEDRRHALRGIDGLLLQREHGLRQAAPAAPAAMSCEAAAVWMGAQLSLPGAPLPAGVTEAQEPAEGGEPGALWLVVRSAAHRIERRRLFTAAAHGLCLPHGTDTEVGA